MAHRGSRLEIENLEDDHVGDDYVGDDYVGDDHVGVARSAMTHVGVPTLPLLGTGSFIDTAFANYRPRRFYQP